MPRPRKEKKQKWIMVKSHGPSGRRVVVLVSSLSDIKTHCGRWRITHVTQQSKTSIIIIIIINTIKAPFFYTNAKVLLSKRNHHHVLPISTSPAGSATCRRPTPQHILPHSGRVGSTGRALRYPSLSIHPKKVEVWEIFDGLAANARNISGCQAVSYWYYPGRTATAQTPPP